MFVSFLRRGYMKERPCDLNQKNKRLRDSRDALKLKNYEKSQDNKKLRDRNTEITESRDLWKARSKEIERQLDAAREETEFERIHVKKERERADRLQSELDTIWKKKSGA